MYHEALDLVVSVIDRRFKKESFSSYAQMETILVKAANSDDYESDVDTGTLPGQLSVLLAMLKISCFDNPGRQHPGDEHPGDQHPGDEGSGTREEGVDTLYF